MAEYMVTIDGGTTRTRLCLWKGEELADTVRADVGARTCAVNGDTMIWKQTIRRMLTEILERNCVEETSIGAVVASGMLTCNLGICEVPHLTAPVRLKDYPRQMVRSTVPEVTEHEIFFVPGLKNHAGAPMRGDELRDFDIMRGEETEVFGLIRRYGTGQDTVFVLPGSHNKYIYVSADGVLCGCKTTLSGELIEAVTMNTILADSLEKRFMSAEEYDFSCLRRGYRDAMEEGLTRTLFLVRLQELFTETSGGGMRSYLLGAVLAGDVEFLKKSRLPDGNGDVRIIIAGSSPVCRAFYDLLTADGDFPHVELDADEAYPLAALGARYLYEQREEQ
ncbi:hypothetical protein BHK98_07695 [Hornefia porci]|uniref:2-dehydro-3-deoxygalactonokinase n=1 Tax=Hornefia porci TaxID=2652292 RepID=A0A1Q9JIB7_9FIRM|nr:2-dehydro-3-deoxygalactonokinase [Hornefia porci]OLR55950.1 hypothetical protein BHK98_07695 [Hornefia porci]